MSIERLQQAVELIRQTANEATPGGWWAYSGEPWYGDGEAVLALDRDCMALGKGEWPEEMQERVDAVDANSGSLFHGDVVREADTDHIVMWDPPTARLVAMLMEQTATRCGITRTEPDQSWLALADAILTRKVE